MARIQALKADGFTESGALRFEATADAYCDELYAKAVALGDRDKSPDAPREVTHDHVRSAALVIAARGQSKQDPSMVACQIGEYLCAAGAGVGGGKIDQTWGVILFGLSLAIGVILFIVRTFRRRM